MINIEAELIKDENLSLSVYYDSKGYPTIGVGHKLKEPCADITLEEAGRLLAEDINKAREGVIRNIPFYPELSEERKFVLINMAFQMGIKGLLGFRKMLLALENRAYSIAANEMLDSKWYRSDSPNRAKRLAEIMRTGVMK